VPSVNQDWHFERGMELRTIGRKLFSAALLR
jgi:hypothetical protein